MRRAEQSLGIEHLEPRFALSAVVGSFVAGNVAPKLAVVHVWGSVHGTYTTSIIGVDAGITEHLSGSGNLPKLGSVAISGTLQGTGFVALGRANGLVTLSNDLGSVTLMLTGPSQGPFASIPGSFQFKVYSATSAFSKAQISGLIDLVQNSKTNQFVMNLENVQFGDAAALQGTGKGSYSKLIPNPDVGPTYELQGTAALELLGQVSVKADIRGAGFVATGNATGTIVLSNNRGSVTLRLTGPTQPGFSALPRTFKFTVINATGAYSGFIMTGVLDLLTASNPAASAFSRASVSPAIGVVEIGKFTMTIRP